MATLVASPVLFTTSPLQIQDALTSLPSPPASFHQAVICSALNLSSPTQHDPTAGLSNQMDLKSTPPPTPITSHSSTARIQVALISPPPATLTPQTSLTKRDLFRSASSSLGALRKCQKLQEAYIDGMMPIDETIDELWRRNVRGYLDEILCETVRSRSVQQELVYAAPRGLFRRPKEADLKPTIVLSVANAEDRKRVKRRVKQLEWLHTEIKRCHLRLFVVIDPVKLQSKGQLDQTLDSTLTHTAYLASESSLQRLCGQKIVLSEPSEMTGERFCTLGGVVMVDDTLCGLTAGHGFFRRPESMTSAESILPSDLNATEIDDQWLDNPHNPFVFDEDDVSRMETEAEDHPTPSSPSTTIAVTDETPLSSQNNTDTQKDSLVSFSVIAPAVPSSDTRIARNCDWALVSLPPNLSLEVNAFFCSGVGIYVEVSGSVPASVRPRGEVSIILAPENVVRGQLSPNSASYGIGPYIFDVRLLILEEDLLPGCSGAWVVQGDLLCGYVIARRGNPRWAYMVPIEAIYDDIRRTLGAKDVRIPTEMELMVAGIRPSTVTDLLPRSPPQTNQQRMRVSPETAAAPQSASLVVPGSSMSIPQSVSDDLITRSPQQPNLAQTRLNFPYKEDRSSQGLQPEDRKISVQRFLSETPAFGSGKTLQQARPTTGSGGIEEDLEASVIVSPRDPGVSESKTTHSGKNSNFKVTKAKFTGFMLTTLKVLGLVFFSILSCGAVAFWFYKRRMPQKPEPPMAEVSNSPDWPECMGYRRSPGAGTGYQKATMYDVGGLLQAPHPGVRRPTPVYRDSGSPIHEVQGDSIHERYRSRIHETQATKMYGNSGYEMTSGGYRSDHLHELPKSHG